MVSGIGALVAVSLAIGLVVGLVALGASRLVTGGGGDTASSSERLEVPDPSPGDGDRDDLHLRPTPLAPSGDDEADEGEGPDEADESDESDETDETDEEDREDEGPQISLSASPLQVSAMQRIDIRGTYPGAEGATVEVQRREGGSWQSFSGVSAQVSGGTFSTWVQTGRAGRNVFRVYDASADVASSSSSSSETRALHSRPPPAPWR